MIQQIISIDASNLNIYSFEDIFYKLNIALSNLARVKCDDRHIKIIFHNVEFIDPYAITALTSLLRYLQKSSIKTSLLLPSDNNVNSYLRRIGLFQNMPKDVCINDNLFKAIYRKSSYIRDSDVLLELTKVRKQEDINKIIEFAMNKISKMLEKYLGYGEKDISSFCTALAETCQNIKDHSEDSGLVSVQKYHSKYNYVVIGICDLGIGIKRSLAYRYNVETWSHAQSIQNALRLGVSRLSDRGKGLYRVTEIVRKYMGMLIIRSGSGMIELGLKCSKKVVPYFPGTQIYIKLLEGSKGR